MSQTTMSQTTIVINDVQYLVDTKKLSRGSEFFETLLKTTGLHESILIDIDQDLLKNILMMLQEKDFVVRLNQIDRWAYFYNYFEISKLFLPTIFEKIDMQITPENVISIHKLEKSVFAKSFRLTPVTPLVDDESDEPDEPSDDESDDVDELSDDVDELSDAPPVVPTDKKERPVDQKIPDQKIPDKKERPITKVTLAVLFDRNIDNNYLTLMDKLDKRSDMQFEQMLEIFSQWKRFINIEPLHNNRLLFNVHEKRCTGFLTYRPLAVSCPIEAKASFREGQSVIVSRSRFVNDFKALTFGAFKDFDYTNAVVAGGAVHACLVDKPFESTSTDIDIFLYGTVQEKTDAFKRTIKYFADLYANRIIYNVNGSVVTLCIVGVPRNIQIIFGSAVSVYDVIDVFDLGYCQMLYDGKSVFSTDDCLMSIKTQTTQVVSTYAKSYTCVFRYSKAYFKGYGLNLDNSMLFDGKSADEIREMLEDDFAYNLKKNHYYYPTSVDDRNKFLVKACLKGRQIYDDGKEVVDTFRFTELDAMNNYNFTKIVDWKAKLASITAYDWNIRENGKQATVKFYSPYMRIFAKHDKHYLYAVVDDKVSEFLKGMDEMGKKILGRRIAKGNGDKKIQCRLVTDSNKLYPYVDKHVARLVARKDIGSQTFGKAMKVGTIYCGVVSAILTSCWADDRMYGVGFSVHTIAIRGERKEMLQF